jgi:hypothetical protein
MPWWAGKDEVTAYLKKVNEKAKVKMPLYILQHSSTFFNILQHSSTFFNILQHSSTFFNILQHSSTFVLILILLDLGP